MPKEPPYPLPTAGYSDATTDSEKVVVMVRYRGQMASDEGSFHSFPLHHALMQSLSFPLSLSIRIKPLIPLAQVAFPANSLSPTCRFLALSIRMLSSVSPSWHALMCPSTAFSAKPKTLLLRDDWSKRTARGAWPFFGFCHTPLAAFRGQRCICRPGFESWDVIRGGGGFKDH